MFDNKEKTDIADIGANGFVQHIAPHFPLKNSSSILGIGDDAALINNKNLNSVISTEILLEGVHFDLSFMPFKHLGYKLVVAGISDIYAMNAMANQLLVNIAFSNRFPLEVLEELYAGIAVACENYTLDLVGGDTSTAEKNLTLAITAIGSVEEKNVIKRSGAKPNDLLVVTGDVGGAYMGLQILEREKRVFIENPNVQPDLEKYDYIVGRQLRPEARKDVIDILKEKNIIPTTMIDISKGIASEIHHLGLASNVGFDIYENKLPIDPMTVQTSLDFNLNPSIVALNGGEDYELLFTISQADYDKIKHHPDFTVIGHATENAKKYQLHTANGNAFDIKAQGW